MRSRNIKPGFYKNDLLAECDPLARILFTGLWCMADREGRLEYRPKKIKAELLPYDTCNIEKLIKQLSDKQFITIYSVNSNNYIEINSFIKHQTPHIKEQASTIPAPDKNQTSTSVESLIPDSLNLIPDSGFTIDDVPDKSGCALSENKNNKKTYPDDFLCFWEAYPKKSGSKKAAFENWKKLNGNKPAIDVVLIAIEQQKEWRRNARDGDFRPEWKDPERWIKNRMWEPEFTHYTEESEIDKWLRKGESNVKT